MTKKYSVKKALVASLLSLALCFSMLIGTTFAWFTDSVTSANNIITSGNLDVELYYQVEGQTEWTKVTESTNVFKENTLWEPGHTEVVKLKVVNEGSLALKYNLGVNVASETGSVNMAGENFMLSEFIKFAVIDGATAYTRDTAVAAAEANGATALKTAYNSGTTALLAGQEATVTMVVYMPTTVGNEANPAKGAATPTINLGINLFATQATYEEDGFGSDYDKDAIIASTPVAIPTEGVTAPVTLTAADVAVEVPAAVINALPAEVTSIALNYTAPQVDATTNTVSFAAVELVDQNGNKIDLSSNNAPIAVTLPAQTAIAANEDVVVLHDGEVVATALVAADGSISYEANHFCEVTVVAVTKVGTADELNAAIAAGENVQFTANITMSANLNITADTVIYGMGYTLTINGTVNLDLNGKTLHFNNSKTDTHNFFIDVKGGTLNAYNGTISMIHTGANMGWNGATSVINVTAGGVLNLENVTVKNYGGTDMNFAVHLNNWGEVTLNADNCVFDAPYCGVRVFNSGPDMNNVTIKNSTLKGGNRAFWVHNYVSADFGGKVYSAAAAAYDKAVVDARMNFDIFNNNNTFEISGTATSPIRYGFNSTVYYNAEGKQLVTATTLAEVMAYAKNGNVIIDAQGANLGDFNYNGTFGDGTVLKNAKFTYVYGASVDGVATFENCEFVSDHSYSANFSDGSYTGKVIFNNCYFDGWNSFGTAITSVEMNNCTFETVIGPYSLLRFYQDAVLNDCVIKDSFDGIDTNKTGTKVELNNCTGIEGKIYNNTDKGVVQVGTWIVDGVVLTDVPAW